MGNKLSKEPEDDEHGNSERLGAERIHLSHQTAPCRAKLMIISEAMLVPGRFSSGVQSSRAPTWAAGPARSRLLREALHSAPSRAEFPCSSSSGSLLSLLPAGPAAPLLQVLALDDRAPLEKRSGRSMAAKLIINFALQGAIWCERHCTLHQASLNFRVHRLRALR